jgi:outer membrane receptor protein involved in Fe transport
MKKFGLLSSSAIGSAALFGLSMAFASPAYAQDDDQVCTPEEASAGTCTLTDSGGAAPTANNEVTVTGSRIRRPGVESVVPVTSIGGEEFFQQGQNNVGDSLNELPQLRTTFGQQNSGRFLGTTGLNLLDLRGLGTQRTLVLVNGRRHVPADILGNGVSPDVNTIPNDLIERVDIVTGGNSAIYGSDAIAGVINFIMRRDFEGLQIRGQAGISGEGYGANQYVAAMYGMNFADGRGNVTIHAEYAHSDRVFGSDIPFLRRVDGFLSVDTDTGACALTPAAGCSPGGADGVPDRVFFRDIRLANINVNSQIAFTQRNEGSAGGIQPGGPQCGTGISANGGVSVGTPYNCVFFFSRDGSTLTQQTGQRVGTGPIGSFIGGNGLTGREENGLSVLPRQDRYNANLVAHYSFSDALEVFLEAKYVRVDTIGQNSGPAFIQGSTLDASRERIRLDNPYLSPTERTQITNLLLAYQTNPGLSNAGSTAVALTATQLANIANGSFRVPIQRNFLDLGIRDESSIRETYRGVIGLRGTFNDDWSYEISANYGRVDEATTVLGNVDVARLLLAMDAGIDPANVAAGIQCRSKYLAAARIDVFGFGPDKLAADVAACVPYDPIGRRNNDAARAYIVNDTTSHASLDQLVLSAFASGDTSQWFSLPGGPVRFAAGLEYRRESLFFQADPFIEGDFSFYNALPTFEPDPFAVKEAFAEIQIPVLADTPFFEQLSFSAAARVASYNNASNAGTVWAYNAGVEWSPIRDVRFRGNYGRSVRAPNLTETAFPLTQNFAPGFTDPCNTTQRNQNATRTANCLADGVGPVDLPNITYSLEFQSGSNPDLQSETSDSWTIGAVIQPRWIPGLSVTVDYYNITVNNVITAVAAQAVANGCYDLPDLNNQFCALFTRYRGATPGPGGENTNGILQGSLISIPLNYAALKRRGIDTEIAYRHQFNDAVRVNARLIYTHNIQNSNYLDASFPNRENRIMSELGDPQDEFLVNLDLTVSDVTFGYQARYIGKQVLNLYEDFFALNTGCTPISCPPNDADWADRQYYPSILYHDIRVAVNVGTDLNFYLGVDNVTNRQPPLGLTGVGAGSGIYNIRGRNFYAGFRARF